MIFATKHSQEYRIEYFHFFNPAGLTQILFEILKFTFDLVPTVLLNTEL